MQELVLTYEAVIRLGFFFGVFGLMALWEVIAPRRQHMMSRMVRWRSNLGMVLLNTLLLRLLFPMAAVGFAVLGEENGFGLFNTLGSPFWLAVVLSVVAMDLIIYLQHVAFHAIPALWRLHSMHHADLDFDVTTGVRFHPIEIVLSMVIKLGVVMMLGPPAVAVILFEVLLNATALFNHANVHMPTALDRVLRWFVVTPDMHRIHHSHLPPETNSNFGFNLPWWDRLLGTYRSQPAEGHEQMTIGLDPFRDPQRNTLLWMLALPFIGSSGEYPINRRWRRDSERRAPDVSKSGLIDQPLSKTTVQKTS